MQDSEYSSTPLIHHRNMWSACVPVEKNASKLLSRGCGTDASPSPVLYPLLAVCHIPPWPPVLPYQPITHPSLPPVPVISSFPTIHRLLPPSYYLPCHPLSPYLYLPYDPPSFLSCHDSASVWEGGVEAAFRAMSLPMFSMDPLRCATIMSLALWYRDCSPKCVIVLFRRTQSVYQARNLIPSAR